MTSSALDNFMKFDEKYSKKQSEAAAAAAAAAGKFQVLIPGLFFQRSANNWRKFFCPNFEFSYKFLEFSRKLIEFSDKIHVFDKENLGTS